MRQHISGPGTRHVIQLSGNAGATATLPLSGEQSSGGRGYGRHTDIWLGGHSSTLGPVWVSDEGLEIYPDFQGLLGTLLQVHGSVFDCYSRNS